MEMYIVGHPAEGCTKCRLGHTKGDFHHLKTPHGYSGARIFSTIKGAQDFLSKEDFWSDKKDNVYRIDKLSPTDERWRCPQCGKLVGMGEVHPCN